MSSEIWSTTWPRMRVAKANLMPFQPGGGQVPGWDETLHVVVGVSGDGCLTIGGSLYDLTVGDVVIIPWAEDVGYAANKANGLTIASIHLVPQTAHAIEEPSHTGDYGHIRARQGPPGLPLTPIKMASSKCLPNLLDVALAIVDTWSLESIHHAWRTYRLDGLTACLVTALDHPPTHNHPMEALLWWLRGNFRRNISRKEMCQRAGLGSTALGHAIRHATGLSPTAFLISVRLDHARRLLANTRMTVHEVASNVGIRDRAHFSKLYRERFGHAPRKIPEVDS